MKRITTILVFLSVGFTIIGCSADDVLGSGITATEFRNVASFEKVSSEGIFKVYLSEGEGQSVKIIADNNVLHRVKTEVKNGKLRLYLLDGTYNKVNLEAHIKVRRLKEMENSGSGDVYINNIRQNGTFKTLNSGSGNIYLNGYCTFLDINNEGSGNILAFEMPTDSCKIKTEGSGDVEVNCKSDLRVQIEGSGNVYYKGEPTIDSTISGSGRIINKN